MSGEVKTLKQIEAARSVLHDAMELLESFSPRHDNRDTEARFVYAAMTYTRRRLEEVQSALTAARYQAEMSPENTTAIGSTKLSSLLKNRKRHRALQELDASKQDQLSNDG
jgi:hypothetical protein